MNPKKILTHAGRGISGLSDEQMCASGNPDTPREQSATMANVLPFRGLAMLEKVISGGQSGADQAGWRGAKSAGL